MVSLGVVDSEVLRMTIQFEYLFILVKMQNDEYHLEILDGFSLI